VDTIQRLRDFIAAELYKDGKPEDLTPEFHLFEHKVIDSLGLLTVISFVETQFGIVVDDDELSPENFETIGAIARLIERKRTPAH
jgi:acyl carrier protein